MADEQYQALINAGYTPEEVKAALDPPEEPPPLLDHPELKDTGNGPSVSYEEALLREYYGEPDADGVYGKEG